MSEQTRKVILMAETGADIPPQVAERYQIRIVPMHVTFGSETKDDGAFPAEDICAYYERTGVLPKTSGSTPEDFTQAFDQVHAQWPEAQILYLAYSAVTTCSYQSAQIAMEGRDYVTALDTQAVCAGQYSIVVTLARTLEAHPEWTVREAAEEAKGLIARSRMCFVPDDLEYLRAGGRVSNGVALVGRVLGIHPLIELVEGRLVATRKLRGKLKALAPKLLEEYVKEKRLQKEELWLIRSPGFPEEVREEVEARAKTLGFPNLTWVHTGGVITTHGGPRAFGVVGFAE
jgi:DegV family protein with EDD domain